MYELDDKQKIEIAKILMGTFNGGDWTELLTITHCSNFLNIHRDFLRDVQWNNDALKQGCISAVDYILNSDFANIKKIWDFDYVQSSIKRKNEQLFNTLQEKLDGIPNIEIAIPKNATQTMLDALEDAKTLSAENGADKAIDRIHTAFHDYLRNICVTNNISFSNDDAINKLHKNITNHLESQNVINEKVASIFKTIGQIIISFNELRNHHSLAHPTENLLSQNDANYVINIIQSTVKYLDSLLISK